MIRVAIIAALALASTPLQAATYTLEPHYTQGIVRWNHLGFSTPAAQFGQGEGTLEFDPANPTQSSVTVTIPLASLHTGVAALDQHLRSEDFFDTSKFPTAAFSSTKVEKGTLPGQLRVMGNLSLHGVTRPVMLVVNVMQVGANPRTKVATAGFEATATLKRSDFGLGRYAPQVSDEIQMQITSQAAEAKGYAEFLKAEAAEEAAEAAAAAKAKKRQ